MKYFKKLLLTLTFATVLMLGNLALVSANETVGTEVLETEQLSIEINQVDKDGKIELTVTNKTDEDLINVSVQNLPISDSIKAEEDNIKFEKILSGDTVKFEVKYEDEIEDALVVDKDEDKDKDESPGIFETNDDSIIKFAAGGLVLIAIAGVTYIFYVKRKNDKDNKDSLNKTLALIVTLGLGASLLPGTLNAQGTNIDLDLVKSTPEFSESLKFKNELMTESKIVALNDNEYVFEFIITGEQNRSELVFLDKVEEIHSSEAALNKLEEDDVVYFTEDGQAHLNMNEKNGSRSLKYVIKYVNGNIDEAFSPIEIENVITDDAERSVGTKDVIINKDKVEYDDELSIYVENIKYKYDEKSESYIKEVSGYIEDTIAHDLIVIEDENLDKDEKIVDAEGKDGILKTPVLVTYSAATDLQEMVKYDDDSLVINEPINHVERWGVNEKEESAIPFETEYTAVDKVDGYRNVKVKGIDGLQVDFYKWSIKNNEYDVREHINSEIVKNSVTEEIEVGNITYEDKGIEFETVYVGTVDSKLGTYEVSQEGKEGTLRTKFVHEVDKESGALINKAQDGTPYVELAPVKEIINVGLIETEVEVLPYATTYRINDSLPADVQNILVKGVEGHVTTHFEHEIDSETGQSTGRKQLGLPKEVSPVQEVIEVGTQYTEELSVPYSVEFYADEDLSLGEQKVSQKGENGIKLMTYNYTIDEDGKLMLPTLSSEEITKEPVVERVAVGNVDNKTSVIEYKTRYIANENKNKGVENILSEGKHGLHGEIISYEVVTDGANGFELTNPVTKLVDEKPIEKVIEKGTRYVVKTVLNFDSKVEYDNERWDIFNEITQVGVNGIREEHLASGLNTETGVLTDEDGYSISVTDTKAPVTEIRTIGTKRPEYKEIESVRYEIPFETKKLVHVSSENMKNLSTYQDVLDVIEDFNSLSYDKLDDNTYIKAPGVNGYGYHITMGSVDEEGNVIPGYPKESSSEISKEPTAREILTLGFNLVEQAESYKVVYEANENMEIGTSNIKTKGVNGKYRALHHDDGTVIASENVKAVNEIVEVGVKEVLSTTTPYEIVNEKQLNYDEDATGVLSLQMENTMYRVEQKGVNGVSQVINIYNVNKNTGEVTTIKSTETVKISDPVNEIRLTPSNKFVGRLLHDEADELFNLINEYRVSEGLEPFVRASEEAQAFSNMRITLYGVGYPSDHIGLYDSNYALYYNTSKEVLDVWKGSPVHNENLKHPNAEDGAVVSVYESVYGFKYYTFGHSADDTLNTKDKPGPNVWNLDYIMSTFGRK